MQQRTADTEERARVGSNASDEEPFSDLCSVSFVFVVSSSASYSRGLVWAVCLDSTLFVIRCMFSMLRGGKCLSTESG